MRPLPLIARLALAGLALPLLTVADAAWAQSGSVFDATGLIELVPPSGITGDGASPNDLYVLALNADGSAMTGVKFKAASSAGTVGDVGEVGGGLYRVTFTAPKVDAQTTANLTLKAKIGKDSVTKTWAVQVAPPRAHTVAIAANPAQLTLGQDRTATLSINLSGGDRQALNTANLRIVASSGTISNLTNLGGGQFSALYTLPALNYPHVAILTLVDTADPSHTYGTLAIPLAGKVDYPVNVTPGASVMMKVGGSQFGPVQADAQGRARVPVTVPPGVTTADVTQINGGQSTTTSIDLKVPEARRIELMPLAAGLPSDARVGVPVRAVVTTPDGKPDGNASVVFTTTAGVVTAGKHEGNGIYVATLTPPAGNTSAQLTVSAYLADKPTTQTASAAVNLVPARPAKVVVSTEPNVLAAGSDGLKAFVKVTGPDNSGLGGRAVELVATGAKLKDAVKDLRNGDYQAMLSTTGSGAVDLTARVDVAATGNPMTRVVVLAAKSRLPADGLSNTGVLVATLDEFGYAVPNVPVTLKLLQGDGALPQTATTNANGVAMLYYTAGRKNGVVDIQVDANGKVAQTALVQAPDSLALPALPTSGPAGEVALINEWRAGLGTLHVAREGQTGMVVPGATGIPAVTGSASRAALASEPANASAGGQVRLKVHLTDTANAGVGGQTLDFLTSAGSVGPVSDLGGGNYEATLTVPPTQTGDIKVSVATQDGAASSFIRIPIGAAEATWGTAPVATAPTAPVAPTTTENPFATPTTTDNPFATTRTDTTPTTTPTPTTTTTVTTAPPPAATPKTPAAPLSDRPWLSLSVGFFAGAYHLDQTPVKSVDSRLFDKAFGVDASTVGFTWQARAFVPSFQYIGGEFSGWTSYWSIDATPFCDVLDSCNGGTLDDFHRNMRAVLVPRYPFDVGASRFWVGARLGGAWSDAPYVYATKSELGIEHETMVGGLALGAELGADIGEHVTLMTSLTEGFGGFSSPYETHFNLQGAYAFTRNVFVALAYDLSLRELDLDNSTSSEKAGWVNDSLNGFSGNLGLRF